MAWGWATGSSGGVDLLADAPCNAGAVEVVGGHLHADAVADAEADEALAHLAADGGEDHVLVVELDAEHGAAKDSSDGALDLDVTFGIQMFLHGLKQKGRGRDDPCPALIGLLEA